MGKLPDYTILSKPRMSEAQFARLLRRYGSPAAGEAAACYRAIVRHGVDPAVELAMFRKESTFGRFGYARSNKSWGNLRRSNGFPSGAGGFAKYPSWAAGAGDCARLLAIYGRNQIRPGRNTSTVQTMPYVWAPKADGNGPDRYGDQLAGWIKQWTGDPGTGQPAQGGGGGGGGGGGSTGGGGGSTVSKSLGVAAGIPCRAVFLETFKRSPTATLDDWYAGQWVSYIVEQRGTGGFGLIPFLGASGEQIEVSLMQAEAALSAAIRPYVGTAYGQLPKKLDVALPDKLADNSIEYVAEMTDDIIRRAGYLALAIFLVGAALWKLTR